MVHQITPGLDECVFGHPFSLQHLVPMYDYMVLAKAIHSPLMVSEVGYESHQDLRKLSLAPPVLYAMFSS